MSALADNLPLLLKWIVEIFRLDAQAHPLAIPDLMPVKKNPPSGKYDKFQVVTLLNPVYSRLAELSCCNVPRLA